MECATDLIAAACMGLLASVSVACGSGGSSSDYSSPVIPEMSTVEPEAAQAPLQEPQSPPEDSFYRGGGDDSLYLNRGSFYDSGSGCSVMDGVVSC